MSGDREKILVFRDEWELLVRTAREHQSAKKDLEFALRELVEVQNDWDVFMRRRFSVASAIDRLRAALGKQTDPDKTPVDSPFASRKLTAPGGYRVGKKEGEE